jgi:hypothetical protein
LPNSRRKRPGSMCSPSMMIDLPSRMHCGRAGRGRAGHGRAGQSRANRQVGRQVGRCAAGLAAAAMVNAGAEASVQMAASRQAACKQQPQANRQAGWQQAEHTLQRSPSSARRMVAHSRWNSAIKRSPLLPLAGRARRHSGSAGKSAAPLARSSCKRGGRCAVSAMPHC